jgi:hypothetical protein
MEYFYSLGYEIGFFKFMLTVMNKNIVRSFKFILKVGVEESVVNAALV